MYPTSLYSVYVLYVNVIVHPLMQPLAVMVTQGTVESKTAACVEMGHVGGAV